jgi:DNA-binding GntR family transcriptional regulator
MYLDLHLTERTELRTHSRLDNTGRPFAELQWDFHSPPPESAGNNTLWGTSTAMRRLAELILQAARLAEEEAAWQTHTAHAAAATPRQVA